MLVWFPFSVLTLFCCTMKVRIDHRTKAISFGLDLHVAHKEEVPEGPYLQVLYDLQRNFPIWQCSSLVLTDLSSCWGN